MIANLFTLFPSLVAGLIIRNRTTTEAISHLCLLDDRQYISIATTVVLLSMLGLKLGYVVRRLVIIQPSTKNNKIVVKK